MPLHGVTYLLFAVRLPITGSCESEAWNQGQPEDQPVTAAAAAAAVARTTPSFAASGPHDIRAAQRACKQLAAGSLTSTIDLSAGLLVERGGEPAAASAAADELEDETAVWWEQVGDGPTMLYMREASLTFLTVTYRYSPRALSSRRGRTATHCVIPPSPTFCTRPLHTVRLCYMPSRAVTYRYMPFQLAPALVESEGVLDEAAMASAMASALRAAAAASTAAVSKPATFAEEAAAVGHSPSAAAGSTERAGAAAAGELAPATLSDEPGSAWRAGGLGWALAALSLVLVLLYGVYRAAAPRAKGRYGRVAAAGAMADASEGVDVDGEPDGNREEPMDDTSELVDDDLGAPEDEDPDGERC